MNKVPRIIVQRGWRAGVRLVLEIPRSGERRERFLDRCWCMWCWNPLDKCPEGDRADKIRYWKKTRYRLHRIWVGDDHG